MTACAVLGIDPGVRGGMALLRADGSVAAIWMLQPHFDKWELVDAVRDAASLLKAYGSSAVFMERVGYIPGDGGQGAFTFGNVVGLLEGAIMMAGFRPRYVSPQEWQARMECLSGGSKNVTKLRAQQLFPGEKVTHSCADALLIAEFGRRRCAGL